LKNLGGANNQLLNYQLPNYGWDCTPALGGDMMRHFPRWKAEHRMPTRTFRSRTSWREKLEKAQEPKVVRIPAKMRRQLGAGTMLIPAPLEVESVIRMVPEGRLITIGGIREKLAAEHSATITCPLVTGIFVRIVAEAAEEDRQNSRLDLTPYWRVVREDGSMMDRFPGGVTQQARLLRAEGHIVTRSAGARPPRVKDLQDRLVAFRGSSSQMRNSPTPPPGRPCGCAHR
jgi:alkylated DNA nucleotide flippase Atl1